ncbi:hypothetical protein P3T42_002820 [Paraburkholderia sp. GAS38]|jgi:hypothetical protein
MCGQQQDGVVPEPRAQLVDIDRWKEMTGRK